MISHIGRGLVAVCIPILCLGMCASHAIARSVLDGLEVFDGEKGNAEILIIAPSSPAARALLRPGDRITAIGGAKIKNLDDYVKVSQELSNGVQAVSIEYYRGASHRTAELTLKGSALQDKWGVTIIPWRASAEGQGGPDYWIEQAKKQIARNQGTTDAELQPTDYGGALLSLFTALNEKPDDLGTAMLVGRQYGELASLYYRRGERAKSVWCLRRALLIYNNSLQKAGDIQEIALVKGGLEDLQKTLV
ncbi:MAG: PDZ domain-containing protein, partial [Candidatus Aureabacteria bacterium]|nr:PDZ domain-containing protein [Candidatus Auribacterota bacterium]